MYPIVLKYKLYFPYSTNYTLPYSSQENVTVKASCYFLRINETKKKCTDQNCEAYKLNVDRNEFISLTCCVYSDFLSRLHDNVKVILCNHSHYKNSREIISWLVSAYYLYSRVVKNH